MNYSDAMKILNKPYAAMRDTDFFDWLKKGGYTGDILGDKVAYLEFNGFTIHEDTVDEDVLRALGYIHNHFFLTEVNIDD